MTKLIAEEFDVDISKSHTVISSMGALVMKSAIKKYMPLEDLPKDKILYRVSIRKLKSYKVSEIRIYGSDLSILRVSEPMKKGKKLKD